MSEPAVAKTGESPVVLKLEITWDQLTGSVNVSGPIANKVVAFGMMEAAKGAIERYHEAQKNSLVITPNLGLRM